MKKIFALSGITRRAWLGLALMGALCSCSSSNPVDTDTKKPFVGWVTPSVAAAGDTVFVFDYDTTTVELNAGDDGGVVTSVKLYIDGVLSTTLTTAPYRTVVSLATIRRNRSARLWATAADPTGKVGATVDTLRFIRNIPPDTAQWTQLSPTRSPAARDGFSWEPDPANGRALLFGGYSVFTFSTRNDLWSFDLASNQWDSLVTTGVSPLSRTRHGAGLSGSQMVVYGGDFIEGAVDSVLEEYSLLNVATLAWNTGLFNFALHPTMGMGSATNGGAVYFYGGTESPSGVAHDSLVKYSFLGDTWQSLHQNNLGPGNRALPAVAANTEENELFLYGGSAADVAGPPAGPPGGTGNFRLNLSTLTWLSTAAPGPPALAGGAAVYDSADHRILMWGGRDPGVNYPVEVWEFTLGSYTWRQVPVVGTPPLGRTGHRMVYDAARRRVVLFGGLNGNTDNNETWELAW